MMSLCDRRLHPEPDLHYYSPLLGERGRDFMLILWDFMRFHADFMRFYEISCWFHEILWDFMLILWDFMRFHADFMRLCEISCWFDADLMILRQGPEFMRNRTNTADFVRIITHGMVWLNRYNLSCQTLTLLALPHRSANPAEQFAAMVSSTANFCWNGRKSLLFFNWKSGHFHGNSLHIYINEGFSTESEGSSIETWWFVYWKLMLPFVWQANASGLLAQVIHTEQWFTVSDFPFTVIWFQFFSIFPLLLLHFLSVLLSFTPVYSSLIQYTWYY